MLMSSNEPYNVSTYAVELKARVRCIKHNCRDILMLHDRMIITKMRNALQKQWEEGLDLNLDNEFPRKKKMIAVVILYSCADKFLEYFKLDHLKQMVQQIDALKDAYMNVESQHESAFYAEIISKQYSYASETNIMKGHLEMIRRLIVLGQIKENEFIEDTFIDENEYAEKMKLPDNITKKMLHHQFNEGVRFWKHMFSSKQYGNVLRHNKENVFNMYYNDNGVHKPASLGHDFDLDWRICLDIVSGKYGDKSIEDLIEKVTDMTKNLIRCGDDGEYTKIPNHERFVHDRFQMHVMTAISHHIIALRKLFYEPRPQPTQPTPQPSEKSLCTISRQIFATCNPYIVT